jgi:hypothetical protein
MFNFAGSLVSKLWGREVSPEPETGMVRWMEQNEYESVSQLRGSMNAASVGDPEVFQRANYLKTLGSYVNRLQAR